MPECYEVELITHSACQFTVVARGKLSATPHGDMQSELIQLLSHLHA